MDRTYPARPLVGIGVVILKDGHVLLVRRAKAPRAGEWSLPGGAQRTGETVADCARREVAEETGLAIAPVAVVAVLDLIDRDPAGAVRHHYTIIDLLAPWQRGEPRAGSDAPAVTWAPLADLADYDLWPVTETVIHHAAAFAPDRPLPPLFLEM